MKHPRNKAVVGVAGFLILAAVVVGSMIQSHKENSPLPYFQDQAALRRWATNSLPLLLEWLRLDQTDYSQPRFITVVNNLLDKQKIIKFRMIRVDRPNRTQFAFDVLCAMGAGGKAAIPELVILLDNKSESLSALAGLVLQRMSPASIPVLIEVLTNGTERARTLAATALHEIGPDANVAMPALRERLADSSLPVRFAAACALAHLGDASKETFTSILEGITSGSSDMRDDAFNILGRLGPCAHAAAPGLVTVITNTATGEPQRFGTMWALKFINRDELIEAVAGLNNAALRSNIVTKLRPFDPQTAAEIQVKIEARRL